MGWFVTTPSFHPFLPLMPAAPSKPAPAVPQLLPIYARNIEFLAFKRGMDPGQLADALGLTRPSFNRIRFSYNRYIDPAIFTDLLRILDCTPNDLLLPNPELDYTTRPTAA